MNQTQISVNHRQIGYRIKEVREQNHISQAQLAEMTDLSVSYISHIENAKRKASLESVIRIVNALGITVDELLAGVQMNNPVELLKGGNTGETSICSWRTARKMRKDSSMNL